MTHKRTLTLFLAGALLFTTAAPLAPLSIAQRSRDNYYSGMQGSVNRGQYDQRYGHGNGNNDRYNHDNHDRDRNKGGGIGPGYGALIGGGGGAALGALFGGGLKGTLIGGAAGAGLGALGGKLAQGNNHNDHRDDHNYHR